MGCFDTTGTGNVWARPISGLTAVVDLDENRVVRLIDSGPQPVSPDPGGFASGAAPPASARQSSQPNYSVIGNEVRWKNWAFHFRMDPRSGLVLSLVRFRDGERERSILYRGSLAEIFVPYMDPDPGWAFRAYLDAGEYGLGPLSLPLSAGSDCPAEATFLDAVLADAHGAPHRRPSVICLFERDPAGPLWRHAETVNGSYAGRPARELVMRTIPSLGNYDYAIDWVLTEAGEIRIEVGATGIDQAKAVPAKNMRDPTAADDTRYGTLIAPNLVGVNHDHFLSFRLDLDIDGRTNELLRQQLVPQRLTGAGRRSLWRLVRREVAVEGSLRPETHGGAETWRVENPGVTTRLGAHPGYELRLGHTATSLLSADDFRQRRAAFSAAPLWVTAYDRGELYAAGMYPNQSRGGDGLPAYVARRRSVANADLVLWCTIGFHHVPRPEDWPVLPMMWHSIALVPSGFFDRNPALDPPPGETAK